VSLVADNLLRNFVPRAFEMLQGFTARPTGECIQILVSLLPKVVELAFCESL
jgi:hypothetical protein